MKPQSDTRLMKAPWLTLLLACGLTFLLAAGAPAEAEAQTQGWPSPEAVMPRPPELEPAVRFWVRVYTEIGTDKGFYHDPFNLSVVYATVPQDAARRKAAREAIQADLKVLASGRRSGLTDSQRRILSLWPEDVSNQTLNRAAARVRWQLGQSNRFLRGLQRSGAYRGHIAQVIESKNLPPELVVLPHVESSFTPNAFSSASAAGMWQFVRSTGRRFLRIDHVVDERMDPYIATYAAMNLLEFNYQVLGTWPLALTAYNHGVGGIQRAVRETGTKDIAAIIAGYRGPVFGFASRNFYPQFLAVLEVEADVERYFGTVSMDPEPDFVEAVTDGFIDAEVFARSVGVSLGQLQADNPALQPQVWSGRKRVPEGFTLKVRGSAARRRENYNDLMSLVPATHKFAAQIRDRGYVVQYGDTLSTIAEKFQTSVRSLLMLNRLESQHRIRLGQRLLLPQNPNPNRLAGIIDDGTYTVQGGDTLGRIAARFGVTLDRLVSLNGISDPRRIYPGQNLIMPSNPNRERLLTEARTSDEQLPCFPDHSFTSAAPAADGFAQAPAAAGLAPAAGLATAAPGLGSAPDSAVTLHTHIDSAPMNQPLAARQLAGIVAPLPPAAVLPDGQVLQHPLTAEERNAPAVDPEQDIEGNSAEVAELLASDPSDYSVADDNTIEIQASETIGHYADWLGMITWNLRRLNGMKYEDPVIIGERIKLSFRNVYKGHFERLRREFHSDLQREFFANYRIRDVERYKVRRGDIIGIIARERYATPIWLLRQYNPRLEIDRIHPGQEVVFPLLEQVRQPLPSVGVDALGNPCAIRAD